MFLRGMTEGRGKVWFSIFFPWLQAVKSFHIDATKEAIFAQGTKKSSVKYAAFRTLSWTVTLSYRWIPFFVLPG